MFYSRNEIAAVICHYYSFLCRLHLGPDALGMPPDGGWTSIPADALRALGKTEEVIDLLRHLPYINNPEGESHILPETDCTDYAHLPESVLEQFKREGSSALIDPPMADDESLDPACVCLARGRRHAWSLILDLTHGTVIWHSNDNASWRDEEYDLGNRLPEDSPRRVDGPEWREQLTYDVKYFFGEFCRKRINDMNWLGHTDGELRTVDLTQEVDEEDEILRQILVDAGFPGDRWWHGFDRGQ